MAAIGEASRRSGVGIETIRYYERAGVVAKPGRTASGRRDYGDADIATLRLVRRCRDLGFPLADAVALLGLAQGRAHGARPDCAAAERLGRGHLVAVRDKIAELRRLEAALGELIDNCAEGRADCPLLDALMV